MNGLARLDPPRGAGASSARPPTAPCPSPCGPGGPISLTTSPTRRLATLAATATAAALVATVLAPPASAAEWDVVASGLDNPRQLSFTGNTLYVAEAGTGGRGPCIEGPEGDACLGTTGAVAGVRMGVQSRVLTGLPSMAAPDGSGAIGPADVFVVGPTGRYAVTVGLGHDPAVKKELGWRARRLGTVVRGVLEHRGPRISADIASLRGGRRTRTGWGLTQPDRPGPPGRGCVRPDRLRGATPCCAPASVT